MIENDAFSDESILPPGAIRASVALIKNFSKLTSKLKESTKILIKGFLNDVVDFIKNPKIKEFVENKLEEQVNAH